MAAGSARPEPLLLLAQELSEAASDLAVEVVDEGLAHDELPSLARLGREGQLGDMPTFIDELGGELADPQPGRMRQGGALAARVRDHARYREELGFAPREIVTEFLLLRRVLWRFVARRTSTLATAEVLLLERRLNDTIDRLVTECVVAYFDRATLELAEQARRDALTQLLNHQALTDGLQAELNRAVRYGHGLSLVFLDIDRFKEINDTAGHLEGDRVLRELARILEDTRRGSDLAGRMGGDEFAVVLVESRPVTAGVFIGRVQQICRESGRLPAGFAVSAGAAYHPTDASTAEGLFRVADARLYESKGPR